MRPIVKFQDGFSYVKFQPGDGTIYTALYGWLGNDNWYIAIGSGDYIRGGYFFRESSAHRLLVDLVKWIDEGKLPLQFVQEYHLFAYHTTKINMFVDKDFDWTVAVAVLFSVIISHTSVSRTNAFDLIKAIYLDDSIGVTDWCVEYGGLIAEQEQV